MSTARFATTFDGLNISVSPTFSEYQFLSDPLRGTTTVTTNATQALMGSATAELSSSTVVTHGLCYQSTTPGSRVLLFDPSSNPTDSGHFSAAESVRPGAGTSNVGFCVQTIFMFGAIQNSHGYVRGWVMVTE